MRRFIFSLVAAMTLVFAQQSMAAFVTEIVTITGPGEFEVTLHVSGDTVGIASYRIPIIGSFDTIDHTSPHTAFAQDAAFVGGPAGFSYMRSVDGFALLEASQDTTTPTPHLIYGFGQVGSNFASEGLNPLAGAPDGASWSAPLRIASGTFSSGHGPSIDHSKAGDAFVDVFLQDGGIETIALNCPKHHYNLCPEPTTLALASLGMISLFGSRRRSLSEK